MSKQPKAQKVRYKKKIYALLETNDEVFVLKSLEKKMGRYVMLYIPRSDEDKLQMLAS